MLLTELMLSSPFGRNTNAAHNGSSVQAAASSCRRGRSVERLDERQGTGESIKGRGRVKVSRQAGPGLKNRNANVDRGAKKQG
jgi:hypothetical protein